MGGRATLLGVLMAAWLTVAAVSAPATPLEGGGVVAFFPSDYYITTAHDKLRGIVLTRWPGPTALSQLWLGGRLDRDQRVLLLLGSGFFHDRQLLHMYYQAVSDPDPLIRQAALTGYRDLLGEQPPRLTAPISDDAALATAREIQVVASSLRLRPLVALWLNSLLASQGQSLPGPRTVVFERPARYCLEVVDRLATMDDLPLLAATYRLVQDRGLNLGFVKLFEGLSLRSLILKPVGPKAGWGSAVWESALTWTDDLLRSRCQLDGATMVRERLAALGAAGLDPHDATACLVWRRLLERGQPTWWALAAERMYDCGGPAVEISRLRAELPEAERQRKWLLDWSRPLARR